MQKNFKQLLNNVTTFMLDVDGVLTDGSLILMPNGDQVRTMNIKDGYAMQLAVSKGYKLAIISGGKSESVRTRLSGLGIKDVFLGVKDKLEVYNEYLLSNQLKPENVLYMGDAMPDFEVMKRAGVATCPSDAANEIKEISIYVSGSAGAKGCVRDVIEQAMRLHKKW